LPGFLVLAVVALTTAGATPARSAAQVAARDTAGVSGRHALLTRRDIAAVALLGATTIALLPADRHIAEEVRDPGPQRSTVLEEGARAFNFLGDPGTLVLGVATYGVGRVVRSPRLTDVGLHTTEAIVLSGAATGLLKGLLGRQRPYVEAGDADDFALGSGFRNGRRASLPSGHTTAAFATAAAVTEETGRWWPHAPRFVGPVLYGGASLVGLARMYDDKHWASDVVLGAGIGTLAGLSVVRYNHDRPRNRLDRWLGVSSLVPTVTPTGDGAVGLAWNASIR